MVEIKITIAEKSPLLLCRFSEEAADKATSGGHKVAQARSRGTPREQAEAYLYLSSGSNGKKQVPIIPQPNLLACIREGGRFFKSGRSKITTQKSSLIPACVDILEMEIPIIHDKPWDVDRRVVRIPTTGGCIWCYRPVFYDWKLKFTVDLDTELLSVKLFREIVDAAGKRIGLGAFRPDCKGPFGKFLVENWQEKNLA
jgi:hypothetical protein